MRAGESVSDERSTSETASATPSTSPNLDNRAKFGGGALGLAWVTAPPFLGFALLANVDPIRTWLLAHGDLAVWVYAAGFALFAGIGMFPTYAQALVGGWVFGFKWGFIGAIGGFVGGAAIGYVVSRVVAGDGFQRWLDARPKTRVIRQVFVERGFWKSLGTVALLRCPPNSPFALTNLAMAASGVHWVPYLIGTAIGMAPRTALATYVAATAAAQGEKDFQSLAAKNPGSFVVGLIAVLVVAAVLGAVAKSALRRAGLDGAERKPPADLAAGG
ncbi:MAG: VTT domain-containing protein [Phycisphaerae bacterium]|nr:VTT domain-containing protein [Phycisphaerae bacterium]